MLKSEDTLEPLMEQLHLKEVMMDIYMYLSFSEETGLLADQTTMQSMLTAVVEAYQREQGF
jgi:hypothetical protein